MSTFTKDSKHSSGQYNNLTIKKTHIKFTGSIAGGLLLNQMIYWSHRTDDPEGWFYKSYPDWEDEICVKQKTVHRLAQEWKERGFLEVKVKNRTGTPINHYRFLMGPFEDLYAKFLDSLDELAGSTKTADGSSRSDFSGVPSAKTADPKVQKARSKSPKGEMEKSKRLDPPYIQRIHSENTCIEDPERGREEDLTGEVISCGIVSEDVPERSVPVTGNNEPSPSCQQNLNEDTFTLPTSSAAVVLSAAAQRPVNPLERQLSRKGIALADWERFKGKYEGFVTLVTSFGYGSDLNLQIAWSKLAKEGWVLDDDFWRGLDLEIAFGMKTYRESGNKPVFGVVGPVRFFEDRRWLQAIKRHEMNERLRTAGLEQRGSEKSKATVKEEGFAAMKIAVESFKRKLGLSHQELEECHDF